MPSPRRARFAAAGLAASVVLTAGVSGALAADDVTPPTGTITIERGAAYTNVALVQVQVPATDDASGVASVELSNDGVTWQSFSYAATFEWNLPYESSGPLIEGTVTVRARWTDLAGNTSAISSDTIVADRTAPTGSVELYAEDAERRTLDLRLHDYSASEGVVDVGLSCDDLKTWTYMPYAARLIVPFDQTGCSGCGTFGLWVAVRDGAGNYEPEWISFSIGPHMTLEFPLPAVTGRPFTVVPILPDDYTLPAGAACRWEFRWGNDRSLDLNEYDETFGSMHFDVPASGGRCAPWTFTLPWVPFRQYEVHVSPFTFESEGGRPSRSALISDSGRRWKAPTAASGLPTCRSSRSCRTRTRRSSGRRSRIPAT